MKKEAQSQAVLGIALTASNVVGVLMRSSGGRFEIVHRFNKGRETAQSMAAAAGANAFAGMSGEDASDFSLTMGGSSGMSAFDDDFDDLSIGGDGSELGGEFKKGPFTRQLREMLDRCAALGYDMPLVAVAIAPPDLEYVDLEPSTVALDAKKADAKKAEKGKAKKSKKDKAPKPGQFDRKTLLKTLKADFRNEYDEGRVHFVPVHAPKRRKRFVAVVPQEPDVVQATVTELRTDDYRVATRVLDSELTLYVEMFRRVVPADEKRHTAVVRVGAEDTLLLMFAGPTLIHFERLRSITTYDTPEKVCSRVMLQQDEQQVEEIAGVLVATDSKQKQLVETFRTFYPNAVVEPLQSILGRWQLDIATDEPAEPALIQAVGLGIRVIEGWDKSSKGEIANLFNSKFQRRSLVELKVPKWWHTAGMLVLLFATTFYFVTTYLTNEFEISRRQQQLEVTAPAPLVNDPVVLQARVDSLQAAYQAYNDGLQVMDSLLIGSDQWSLFMQTLAFGTGNGSGVWLEDWEANGDRVMLKGSALSRSRIAQFARRVNGSIEEINSENMEDDDREARLYHFTIQTGLTNELPKVATYLRENLEVELEEDELVPPTQPVSDVPANQ